MRTCEEWLNDTHYETSGDGLVECHSWQVKHRKYIHCGPVDFGDDMACEMYHTQYACCESEENSTKLEELAFKLKVGTQLAVSYDSSPTEFKIVVSSVDKRPARDVVKLCPRIIN